MKRIFSTVCAFAFLLTSAAAKDLVVINSIRIGDEISIDFEASEEVEDGRLYLAEYEENGALKEITATSIDISEGVSSYSVANDKKTGGLMAFIWDDCMRPLSEAFVYNKESYANDIFLMGDSVLSFADPSKVSVDGSVVTIQAADTYNVYGSLDDGQIIIALGTKKEEANVYLHATSISCSNNAPIDCTEGKLNLYIDGTNTISDGEVENEDRHNAAIFSKRDLTIQADSSASTCQLNVNGKYSNGIRCKADLSIGNTNVCVNAVNNGIKGDKSVKLTKKAKEITIISGGDGIKSDYAPEIVDTSTGDIDGGMVTINGGIINITTSMDTDGAVSDGIQADLLLTVAGGNICVNATGDGLVANAYEGDEGTCEGGNGSILISAGTFDITTNGGYKGATSSESTKGIKAVDTITITGGTFNINSYDDAIHANNKVDISGGMFDILTSDDGVHGDSYFYLSGDADINVNSCYEGLEAAEMYISGGAVHINASDDGLNAAGDNPNGESGTTTATQPQRPGGGGANPGGEDSAEYGYLQIDGGYIFVTTSSGDGLDSNGDMIINGGVVIVDGATLSSEDGLDFSKSAKINGGFVLTMTAGGMDGAPTGSSQKILTYGFSSSGGYRPGGSSGSTLSAGSYAITDASGNMLCTFKRTKGTMKRIVFSAPSIPTSGTFYIRRLTDGQSATDALLGEVNSADYTFTPLSSLSYYNTTKYAMSLI